MFSEFKILTVFAKIVASYGRFGKLVDYGQAIHINRNQKSIGFI